MEKIMTTLFLSTLLSMFLLATADPVLDDQGNNVTTDASYYIEIDGITNFQKLTLKSINGSCARYAAYDFQQAIPVRFRPYYPGNDLQIGQWYRFRIEFTAAPCCVGSREWTVDSSYVVAAGDDPKLGRRYFAVTRDPDSGKYMLRDCRRCPVCKDGCFPIGLDSGAFLTTGVEEPLNVFFRKAAPGRHSTNRAMGSLLGRSAE